MSPESVREALTTVIDPEAGMNVLDLGLVYGIEVANARIRVRMTMTTPACPSASLLAEQAREAVRRAFPEAEAVDVELVWDPPWHPGRMSDDAKRRFGWRE